MVLVGKANAFRLKCLQVGCLGGSGDVAVEHNSTGTIHTGEGDDQADEADEREHEQKESEEARLLVGEGERSHQGIVQRLQTMPYIGERGHGYAVDGNHRGENDAQEQAQHEGEEPLKDDDQHIRQQRLLWIVETFEELC